MREAAARCPSCDRDRFRHRWGCRGGPQRTGGSGSAWRTVGSGQAGVDVIKDADRWVAVGPAGPTVGEFATVRVVLEPSLLCRELDIMFRENPGLRSVVIGRADGTITLINRTFFYQTMVGPKGFGWALYQNKSICVLDSPEPLRVTADRPAVAVGWELLDAGQSAEEDVLVSGLAGGPATLGVATLFAKVAHHSSSQADRFQALIQNLSDVVMVLDAAGFIRYLSPSFERITGGTIAERIGQDAFERMHPNDRPALRVLLQRSLASPGVSMSAEFQIMVVDGSWRRFEMVGTNLIEDPNIGGIVINYRDVTERRLLEDELRHRTLHDSLTGLANRTLLVERIEHALTRAARSPEQLIAVLFIDLDGFKAVNDSYGHGGGDELLVAVAAILSSQVRAGDTVARVGGDEFAVVLENLDDPAEAASLAARVHLALEQSTEVAGHKLMVRASIGVALAAEPMMTGEGLIQRADLAMYAAKVEGKNRTVLWGADLEHQLIADQAMAVELQEAVDLDQLVLHYQPVISISTGELTGVEALVRWQHPTRGLLPPDQFIPLAERTGIIAALTRWVLTHACAQARIWQDRPTAPPLVMAINISAVQLGRPELNTEIASVLDRTGLRPELLELEITETALISNFDAARTALEDFKRLGIRIAIDDFGTGYSSLSYLHQLPVDVIKIDKSFIHGLRQGNADELVRGLISLAHVLKLEVTAEGVEEPHQHNALLSMQCDRGQGYLYARPGPATDLDSLPPPDKRTNLTAVGTNA